MISFAETQKDALSSDVHILLRPTYVFDSFFELINFLLSLLSQNHTTTNTNEAKIKTINDLDFSDV